MGHTLCMEKTNKGRNLLSLILLVSITVLAVGSLPRQVLGIESTTTTVSSR